MTRYILYLAFFAALAVSQDGNHDPGPPPPEPPANLPMCHNYHDNDNVNCHCPKAMMEGGSPNGTPDPARGQKWCSHYCHETSRCGCLSPVGNHPAPKGKRK